MRDDKSKEIINPLKIFKNVPRAHSSFFRIKIPSMKIQKHCIAKWRNTYLPERGERFLEISGASENFSVRFFGKSRYIGNHSYDDGRTLILR